MGDRLRLMVTGVAAVGAIGLTLGGQSIWSAINASDMPYHQVPLSHLRDFEGITLRAPDDVIVSPGPNFSVRTEGPADSVKYLQMEVEQGVLKITRRPRNGWWGAGGGTVKIYVTMPGLTRVWITGTGDISADKMEVKDFRARLDGPGGLNIKQLVSNDVQLTLNGPGNMELGGSARDINVIVGGPGSVQMTGLKAQTADITINGPGDVEAHADRSARLRVNGPGHVQVEGTTRCQIEKSGPGGAECTS